MKTAVRSASPLSSFQFYPPPLHCPPDSSPPPPLGRSLTGDLQPVELGGRQEGVEVVGEAAGRFGHPDGVAGHPAVAAQRGQQGGRRGRRQRHLVQLVQGVGAGTEPAAEQRQLARALHLLSGRQLLQPAQGVRNYTGKTSLE